MSENLSSTGRNLPARLFLLAGILFLILAVLFNEFLVSLLDPTPPSNPVVIDAVRDLQVNFLIFGVASVILAFLFRRLKPFATLAGKDWFANLTLALLIFTVPLLLIEFGMRPLALKGRTSVFVEDPELVWKFRPNSEGVYGDTWMKINGKGLRGAELEYAKPDGVKRILYLGDSVTAGYKLPTSDLTYPYQTEKYLEEASGLEIQTINSGVDGYSPWQELIYLQREGYKYEPDLVLLQFDLNDVTQKFTLKKFGGSSDGFLEFSYTDQQSKWNRYSGLMFLARKIKERLVFGREVRQKASLLEQYKVESLFKFPDNPEVIRAWDMTLENIDKIHALCQQKGMDFAIAIFPFTIQFKDYENSSAPQKKILEYAEKRGIAVIDVAVPLMKSMKENGASVNDYFLDQDHLTAKGSEIVGQILADFIAQNRFLTIK